MLCHSEFISESHSKNQLMGLAFIVILKQVQCDVIIFVFQYS